METRIRIGTSGFTYRDWVGSFYPEDLPPADWLTHYASRLSAVELGASSHRIPGLEDVRHWTRALPASFQLCLTASAVHTRHAVEGRPTALRGLLDAARQLGQRAGPVLVQLPHGATRDVHTLTRLLSPFGGLRLAVEPRRDDPITDAVLRALSARGAALVVTDEVVGMPRVEVTSSFVYLRLRKVSDEHEWDQWVERMALLEARGLEVYAFLRQGRREPAALRALWLQARLAQRNAARQEAELSPG